MAYKQFFIFDFHVEFLSSYHYFQQIDLVLQVFQKCACVSAVHLCMMELERDGQVIPKPFLFVSAPNNKGIIENATVHTNSTVDFRIYDAEVPMTILLSDKSLS